MFNTTTRLVRSILEALPQTRDDDYLLWLNVLEISAAVDFDVTFSRRTTLHDFLADAKFSKYPHFETVSRARRKLQAKFPELKATEETRKMRAALERQYRDYAMEKEL